MGVENHFRWEEDGDTSSEQKFNYSMDESAKALHDWFEAITETERLFAELPRSPRPSRQTGRPRRANPHRIRLVPKTADRRRPVSAPARDQIAQNEIYLHMARQRAAMLGEAIRAAQEKTAKAK